MHVSHESAEQTRERLLRVLAAAELRIHDGTFVFTEHPVDSFPASRIANALAFVRDERVWSVLEPAHGTGAAASGSGAVAAGTGAVASSTTGAEALRVLTFHFRADLDNGGFVGWLASHLKATLGTGIAVICGCNTERGGIFDHWAVPQAMFAAVLAEIHRLRGATEMPKKRIGLDGVVMQVTATASDGVVDSGTQVAFRQCGARVLGRYAGGSVRRGCLVGVLAHDRLTFRYAQAEISGALHAGRSTCELERLADGRLRLLEHFAWSTRPGNGTNVFEQVA